MNGYPTPIEPDQELLGRLAAFYRQDFVHRWSQNPPPHFDTGHILFFEWLYGTSHRGPYEYSRAFFSSLAVRSDDKVLDLGCGDGFLTTRFLSHRAKWVDAVDIDPNAIAEARRRNACDRVTYHQLNAVTDPFPGENYDLICLDGALGHMNAADTQTLLHKVAEALKPDGLFVGSESLGTEGADHLQFFDTAADILPLLRNSFPFVSVFQQSYEVCPDLTRREAYWRCSRDSSRIGSLAWEMSRS